MTRPDLPVHVIGVNPNDAVAAVDGVRVRVRRNLTTVRWMCDQHGTGENPDHCEHTAALARTPT